MHTHSQTQAREPHTKPEVSVQAVFVILALGRRNQEDQEVKVILGYVGSFGSSKPSRATQQSLSIKTETGGGAGGKSKSVK